MASKADLPLPVYFLKHDTNAHPIIAMAIAHTDFQTPSLQKQIPNDDLADIQEWLRKPVFRIGARTLTAMQIISETANTLGVAHYDEDTSEHVEAMNETILHNISSLSYFHCSIATVLVALSEWVLSELAAKKLIS